MHEPPRFCAEGPCPSNLSELRSVILRYLCGSPAQSYPVDAAHLSSALRRAYRSLGHEKAALSVFRESNAATAIRELQKDLLVARCEGALSIKDSCGEVSILSADRRRIYSALAPSVNGGHNRSGDAGQTPESRTEARKRLLAEAEEEFRALLEEPAKKEEEADHPWRPPSSPKVDHPWKPPSSAKADHPWRPPSSPKADQPWRPPPHPAAQVAPRTPPQPAAPHTPPDAAPVRLPRREASRSRSGVASLSLVIPGRRRRRRDEGERRSRSRRRDRESRNEKVAAPSGPPPGAFEVPASAPSPRLAPQISPRPQPAEPDLLGALAQAVSRAVGVTPSQPPSYQAQAYPALMHGMAPGHHVHPHGHHGYPQPMAYPYGHLPQAPAMHMMGHPPPHHMPQAHYPAYAPHPHFPGYYMPVYPGMPGHPPPRDRRDESDEDRRKKEREEPPPPAKFDDDHWEEPRERTQMKLLGEECPEEFRRLWTYPLSDENRRSFAGYVQRALDKDHCRSFFAKIRDSCDWKQPEGIHGQIPRKTCWLVKGGCRCKYRYGGLEVEAQEFPKWMHELMEIVLKPCGISPKDWPNSCNLNLYEDGGMTVGWHSDDERLFQGKFRDCRIISLSLGATRKFELRRNWPEDRETQLQRVTLSSGDLLTMEGMVQKHFQHRVPRENVKEPRINLTWRWVKRHVPDCPAGRKMTHASR
ncbi:unnamed protein product [Effrenium voratum]|uniref:Fe2OG dioxygenase domain-containing protein n=1 Tax=Effrenium voratum TaxID=2562239 RepID=A0AA36MQG7_9DINO|nr:unnamed protein product [Effrenium voratum]